jgi:hypothetical protein
MVRFYRVKGNIKETIMEITDSQLQMMLTEAYRRGYDKGRAVAADDVSSGAILLTSSSRALEFLYMVALGRGSQGKM